jgi:hypothetical protein
VPVVSEPDEFSIGVVGEETEAVESHEVNIFSRDVGTFEGVVGKNATGSCTYCFNQIVHQLVESADEIGLLSEEKIQVLFVSDALFGLDAAEKQKLKESKFFSVFAYLPHLDQPFIKRVDKPHQSVKMFGSIKNNFVLRFHR